MNWYYVRLRFRLKAIKLRCLECWIDIEEDHSIQDMQIIGWSDIKDNYIYALVGEECHYPNCVRTVAFTINRCFECKAIDEDTL